MPQLQRLMNMHELSLVQNIFSTLEESYPDRISQLRGIWLSAGELSNVQPLLMQSAFDAVLQERPEYAQTRLHVEVLPIRVRCSHCHTESEIKNYVFVCAQCQQPVTQIIQGQELLITKLEFEN